VKNLRNICTTNDTVTIGWNHDQNLFSCGAVTYFVTIVSVQDEVLASMDTPNLQITFVDLMAGTPYNIVVLAGNRAGNGTIATSNTTTTEVPSGMYNCTVRIMIALIAHDYCDFLSCTTLDIAKNRANE